LTSADILSKAAAAMILANVDFPVDSPFIRNIVTDSPRAYATFMFSNKLGAIITYLLIQAMSTSNKFTRNTENDEEKDLNVEWWIEDAISSLRRFLLPIFKDFVRPFLTSPYDGFVSSDGSIDMERGGEQFLHFMYDRPFYSLNEKSISELMSAFSKSYPNMTNKLEKIRCQLPNVIAQEISRWEHRANRSKYQEDCIHDYKPTRNNKISHCRKCHKTKYKKSLFLKAL